MTMQLLLTSATSEGAQAIFSKNIFLKSNHSSKKDGYVMALKSKNLLNVSVQSRETNQFRIFFKERYKLKKVVANFVRVALGLVP